MTRRDRLVILGIFLMALLIVIMLSYAVNPT